MEPTEVIRWILRAAGVYLACGALFAIPFVAIGAARIDPVAKEGTRGFRLLILPGVVLLWPLLLRRWVTGAPAIESNAHRRAALRTRDGERSR